jgi:virulence-associated protein VapD
MRYKCISVLAVDKQYRGTQLNYQLVTSTLGKLKQAQCDWAYIQIYYELSTHDYWKRYGAIEIFDDSIEAKHYFLAITDKAKQAINKFRLSERRIRLSERDLQQIVENVLSKIL